MITIQQYKTDIGFKTLVDGVNDGLYIVPKYQRKYRWKKEQIESLVESLIKGYPIPPIYTVRNADNQLEIIDGQQRIMSLFFYYIGAFLNIRKLPTIDFSEMEVGNEGLGVALKKNYSLEELKIYIDIDEKNSVCVDYDKLSPKDKRRVDYSTISVIEIKIDAPERKEEILRTIFANLNKGGTLLSEQEQRNGIYGCIFYDMLKDFNRNNKKWRTIWGKQSEDERDMQTLLRFCALKEFLTIDSEGNYIIQRYEDLYKDLLDRYSEQAMKYNAQKVSDYKESLTRFVNRFQETKKLSTKVALLESLYVVEEISGLEHDITNKDIDNILKSEEYIKNTRQGTSKMSYMNKRWKAVYDILSGKHK